MKTKILILFSAALACLGAALTAQADDRINMALSSGGGVATESSNPFTFPAANGNDGRLDTAGTSAALTHTSNGDNEWWEVNLGASKTIAEVRVWLRTDSTVFSSRDANLRLVIYNDAAHTSVVYSANFDGSGAPLPYRNMRLVLPAPVAGQVVRIEHPVGVFDYIALSEVQVFNQSVEEVNLALGGSASMSTTDLGYNPELAIDGLVPLTITGGNNNISTARTDGTENPLLPWWQVDLGSNQPISAIRVFTAGDTVQTRNDDLAVVVLDNASSLVSSNYNAVHSAIVTLPGHDFPTNKQYVLYTFNPAITGQVVRVTHTLTNAGFLVLPEVEVFKSYSTPPAINITQGPTNVSIDQNSFATLLGVRAGVSNANINYLSYQWQSNGVDIAGANGTNYTTPTLSQPGTYTYGVKCILPGLSVTTQAVVTVIADLTPPLFKTNTFAALGYTALTMTVVYNEPMDPTTATNTANYVFAGSPTVSSPTLLPDGKTVTLVVNNLAAFSAYSLSISGVKDLSLNTMVTTNITGTATIINSTLSGSLSVSSGLTFNLTTEGKLDWATWAFGGVSGYDIKDSLAGQISNYSLIGTGSVVSFGTTANFKWTDGTPNVTGTNSAGVKMVGQGNGFALNVPASASERVLNFYCGINLATLHVEAMMSDGSAPVFINETASNAGGTSNRKCTFRFASPNPGAVLQVRAWPLSVFNTNGGVVFQAASLSYGTNIVVQAKPAGGGQVEVTWPVGFLEEAPDITGPWTLNGATSPYTFTPTGAQKYFRVLVQ